MAKWMIRVMQETPIVVEADDARDLAAEWVKHLKKRKRRAIDHVWQIAKGHAIDARAVYDVQRAPVETKKRIGF